MKNILVTPLRQTLRFILSTKTFTSLERETTPLIPMTQQPCVQI